MNGWLCWRWPVAPLIVLSIVSLTGQGCGKSTAQVAGKVLWSDGTPVEGEIRVIRFEPTSDSPAEVRKSAFADIEQDGTFEMMTRQYGDGVIIGRYHVTFTVLKTAAGQESAVPARYTAAATSPFTIDVTADQRDLLFELDAK